MGREQSLPSLQDGGVVGGGVAEATGGRKLMTSSVTPHVAAQLCELEVAAATGASVCKGAVFPQARKY